MKKYERATEIITDYISNDMDYKDRYYELMHLLKEVYPKSRLEDLIYDYNLDNKDEWGEEIVNEIAEHPADKDDRLYHKEQDEIAVEKANDR